MKKFLFLALCAIVSVCAFTFCACGEEEIPKRTDEVNLIQN